MRTGRMRVSELKGKVQTVTGPIDPGELGVTLMHEHLLIDLECYFQAPDAASERAWVNAPLTMERLGGVGARVAYNLDNLKLLDEGAAVEEASRFRYAGGGTLVDVTSRGIARDPLALARISRATGLNVVMGASYYVPFAHPLNMDSKSEDEIAEEIVHDVTVGVGETGIRSGIIGEVGNFHPLSENERKVLRASAAAHLATGAPITIHPGADRIEIVDILAKAGADPRHVVMGHLGPGPAEPSSFKPLAETRLLPAVRPLRRLRGHQLRPSSRSSAFARHRERRAAPAGDRVPGRTGASRPGPHLPRRVPQDPSCPQRRQRLRPHPGEHSAQDATARVHRRPDQCDPRGEPQCERWPSARGTPSPTAPRDGRDL